MPKRTVPSKWLLAVCAALFLGLAPLVHAALPLTIITLQHRSVDEIAPALQAHLAPGGQLSGVRDKLLIRTTPANLAELRTALAALDVPARRLRIVLRMARESDAVHRAQGVGGSVRSGDVSIRLPDGVPRGGTRIEIGEVRIGASETRVGSRRSSEQFVETRDGGRASLFFGQSVPLRFDQVFIRPDGVRVVRGTVFRDVGEAVSVQPHLIGERVRLVIRPESSALRADGAVDVMQLETEAEGRLGEWIAIGGAAGEREQSESRGVAIGGSSAQSGTTDAAFWLRVEAIE